MQKITNLLEQNNKTDGESHSNVIHGYCTLFIYFRAQDGTQSLTHNKSSTLILSDIHSPFCMSVSWFLLLLFLKQVLTT
jgi:hypothetical protein